MVLPSALTHIAFRRLTIFFCSIVLAHPVTAAPTHQLKTPAVTFSLDAKTGEYQMDRQAPGQHWAGSFGRELQRAMQGEGQDGIGKFQSVSFTDSAIEYRVQLYFDRPVALFSWSSDKGLAKPPAEFPDFSSVPSDQHIFSYENKTFAVPQFRAEQNSGTPFVLFDDQANTTIISPAANFMTASLRGDGQQRVSSGFVPQLANLPENFSHRTIIVFGKGINATYQTWGDVMLALLEAKRPTNDADVGLKYLGYWTDNKATYYYHYDVEKGYAGTILAVRDELKKLGIPIGYMQLDSWWYKKTSTGADGKEGPTKKNKDLPDASWNKYGGLEEYVAHEDLFPAGLGKFQQQLGLPMITHNRWVDLKSPYREKFQISGIAATDPAWWDQIAQYCKDNGVVTYEQDWLDRIYNYSPEFKSTPDRGEKFMDEMSRSTGQRGLTMQYCMGLPRHYLQGAKYPNLTSVRVSEDGFERKRWTPALYVSTLAGALQEWPWTDVFMSRQTPNVLLATLTAGMVGVGDAMGKFDKENLMLVARPDGVIVKPDRPITPIDASFIADATAKDEPMIAATYSQHGDLKTAYVFVYPQTSGHADFHFAAADFGITGDAYVYDWKNKTAKKLKAGENFTDSFGSKATIAASDPSWAYYIVSPVTRSGIALIGDDGKFASMGKQRIEKVEQDDTGLNVSVRFAQGEQSVTLHGMDSSGKPFAKDVTSDGKELVKFRLNGS